MARLIDADDLDFGFPMPDDFNGMMKQIDIEMAKSRVMNAPTIDAVEVVRCKNCDWHRESNGVCTNPKCGKSWYGCPVPDEHYCSYGERRSDNAAD